MKRPFRTGLVAGLLALTLAGAACGSGSNSGAQNSAKTDGAVSVPTAPVTTGTSATSGGAALVVKPTINSAADLKGQRVATPQLGNTQDVAARAWFLSQGLKPDTQGGGDVKIVPQDNAQTLDTFKSGQIAGAWVPEPWATRLVNEGGGKALVDERSPWPAAQFRTTPL